MTVSTDNVFTLEIDGKPTLVFDATNDAEAEGICALPEFRDDLSEVTSNGAVICDAGAVLAVRRAYAPETVAFREAVAKAVPSDAPTMAFLIPIDGVVVTIVDPE
jgi:hypothetical protein